MTNIETLKKSALFDGFSDDELHIILKAAKPMDIIHGDSVFSEGSKAESLYVIHAGVVEISKKGLQGHDKGVVQLSSGTVIGEMSFIDQSPRAGSATAKENLKLLEFPYSALSKVLEQNPAMGLKFYKGIAETLCKRVRATTTNLSSIKELNLRDV